MKVYNITGEKTGRGFLPDHIRCVIVGPSGCGKTNLLLNILFGVDKSNPKKLFLDIDRLDIISPTCYQKCWDMVREELPDKLASNLEVNFHDEEVEILNEISEGKSEGIGIVYDDCMFSKDHKYISKVFIRGRHYNAHVFFLTQNFIEIPKTIRRNMIFLILFKGIDESIPHIAREIGAKSKGYDLKETYEKICGNGMFPFSYLTIDLDKKKFYKNFNEEIV